MEENQQVQLPVEVWQMILHHCTFADRVRARAVCRTFAALAHQPADDWLNIPPCTATHHATCAAMRYRNVRITASGSLDQWAAFSQTTDVRRLHWSLGFCMPRIMPAQLTLVPTNTWAALPTQLRELVIHSSSALSEAVMRSLERSLPLATSLETVGLHGVSWTDALHMVTHLSQRTRNPYNSYLQALTITISEGVRTTRAPPSCIDVSGLSCTHSFSLDCADHDALPLAAREMLRETVDLYLAQLQVPLTMFVYRGLPLRNTYSWAHAVHNSAATLHSLVVPSFEGNVQEAEAAVDAVHTLEQLTVASPAVRLDFVLRNKRSLRKLIHHGSVYSADQLLAQLAPLGAMVECFIGSLMGTEFAHRLATASGIHWPRCERLAIGGVDAELADAVRRQLAATQGHSMICK